MNEVEPVTDNDKRKLIGELRFLEEVLDFLRVVEAGKCARLLGSDQFCSG
jgi:hypothetical protein